MTAERIQIKLYRQNETDLKEFIPTFHEWIREETVDGLLIDVADYRHVPNGPGLLLMGHEGDYSVSNDHGRTAIAYKHKRVWPTADLNGRVRHVLGRVLHAEQQLQERFATPLEAIEISFPDRLNAPNTADTFALISPELETAVSDALRKEVNFVHASEGDARHMLTANATL